MQAFKAAKYVLPGCVETQGYLVVEDGKFLGWVKQAPECDVVDLGDVWVTPGFVDTHIHGFYDNDVMDCDAEGINVARQELVKHGTTSWLATTLTAGIEETGKACQAVAEAREIEGYDFVGCRTQGIFLEGPFFTYEHKGAQNPAYMLDPDYEIFSKWQQSAKGLIKKSAIAPEREGSVEYSHKLYNDGVVTAMGHSSATYDEATAAIDAGASVFVHTYNGMSGLHHREPGLVGAAMTTTNTYAEVICDGMHINPAAVKALVNAKGWEHTFLISDCLRCGGMPEGEYVLGEFPIVMKDGVCRLRDSDSIAGSIITIAQAVKNVYDWSVVTAEQAIRMGSEVAAKANNIADVCGYIMPGRDADFCVLDTELNLVDTYFAGKKVEK